MGWLQELGLSALSKLDWNGWLLFFTRGIRLFAYGFTGLILAIYLNILGFPDNQIGAILTLTLLGDAAISLFVTVHADAFGRRLMLVFGCLLMLLASAVFSYVHSAQFWLVVLAATAGVISPSGSEVGPFMALEQSILSERLGPEERTGVFSWYNILGFIATAFGAGASGVMSHVLTDKFNWSTLDAYHLTFAAYGGFAVILAGISCSLSNTVELGGQSVSNSPQQGPDNTTTAPLLQPEDRDEENNAHETEVNKVEPLLEPAPQLVAATSPKRRYLGMSADSLPVVLQLSALFSLDAFGGSLVTATLLAYYFHVTYQVSGAFLGWLIFTANIIASVSSLAANSVAARFGLINTMVFTHIPSNIFIILIPLMPNVWLAATMLFLCYSLNKMDVAPRQAYVASVVPKEDRTATIGVTNIVRSLGAAFGPLLAGYLAKQGLWKYNFIVAGSLKIVYDLLLLLSFRNTKPAH